MPISISCACGRSFRAPDSAAGKRGKCPACGAVLKIPDVALQPISIDEPLPDAAPAGAGSAVATRMADDAVAVRPSALADRPSTIDSRDTAVQDAVSHPDDFGPYGVQAAPVGLAAPSTAFPIPPPAALPPLPVATAVGRIEDDAPVGTSVAARTVPWAGRLGGYAALFLVLAIGMLPLAWYTLFGQFGQTSEQRWEQTLEENPEAIEALYGLASDDDGASSPDEERFFRVLPGQRIVGALHGRDTMAHWFYAVVAAAGFFSVALYILPETDTPRVHLLLTGLFTATVGVLLLFAVQWAADATQGVVVRGRGIGAIIFWIVKLIGISYAAADNPENGFVGSLLGYTFGVGLCEELCKALPIIWAVRGGRMQSWRDACRWGFMSGVGFGVAEAIMYSSRYYNGIASADLYLVRYVSCVALHAVWACGAAVVLYKRQSLMHDSEHWLMFLLTLVAVLILPILLHGLYDTLLKKEMETAALLTAAFSGVWLAWHIHRTTRVEAGDDSSASPRAAVA